MAYLTTVVLLISGWIKSVFMKMRPNMRKVPMLHGIVLTVRISSSLKRCGRIITIMMDGGDMIRFLS